MNTGTLILLILELGYNCMHCCLCVLATCTGLNGAAHLA